MVSGYAYTHYRSGLDDQLGVLFRLDLKNVCDTGVEKQQQ